jgi:hypothetical protein
MNPFGERELLFLHEICVAMAGDSLVTGYEVLIPAMPLPDPDDRSAFTRNLRDLPSSCVLNMGADEGRKRASRGV